MLERSGSVFWLSRARAAGGKESEPNSASRVTVPVPGSLGGGAAVVAEAAAGTTVGAGVGAEVIVGAPAAVSAGAGFIVAIWVS
jgi:hypothetical protein